MASIVSIEQLILHPRTWTQLEQFLTHPTHALMLTGPMGVGLGTIARTIGHQLAGANVIYVAPTLHNKQKTTIINADDIAELGSIVRNHRDNVLVIIIDGADCAVSGVFERMLKLIEEPVPKVYYIFTAHSLQNIPATIMSRSALIKALLPTEADCAVLYSELDSTVASQVKFMANRRPALIKRLTSDDNFFVSESSSMQVAKEFMQNAVSRRMEIIDDLPDKESATSLCHDLAQLVISLASAGRLKNSQKVASQLLLLSETVDRLTNNGNLRLQLTNLAINFGA